MTEPTLTARAVRAGRGPATALPVANFLSFFAIAVVEFSVPYIAVATLGADSLIIATLGICRFAPQVLLARAAARIVERYDQRTVMLASEALRVAAFALSAFALLLAPAVGLGVFAAANICLACGSVLTAVSTQVLVPALFSGGEMPRVYARLGIAESAADAAAPFLTGVSLGAFGVSATFGGAAALAACACALLMGIPRIRVPAEPPGPADPAEPGVPSGSSGSSEAAAGGRRARTLRQGLWINLRTPPLRILTIWSVSYNFGQCLIEAVLLIALVQQTPVTAASFGVIRTCSVVFTILGAFLAERLPAPLRRGLGTAVFGCGAVCSYAVLGAGVYVGGAPGLALVLAGFALDEFCSGVVLVRIQAFRARAITDGERPIASAAFRAVNLTAVPAGFAVGGVAGLVADPAALVLTTGLALLLPGALVLSRHVRHTT
ncbi:MFS transporter [Thermopolyspora sp. NPDC052614]|uniref:MFS transporter n=1 Tax=Thermopolyspora sp. NPDC052614 TaxID=3155682 RepID=UPI00343B05AE